MRINDKSKSEKEEIRRYLRIRDGDGTRAGTLCFVDGCMNEELYREKTGKDFDICHLDDNPENWDTQNLFLAAHKCNVRLTPHGKIDHEKNFLTRCKALKTKGMKSLYTDIYIDGSGLRIDNLSLFRNVKLKPLAIQEFEKIIEEKQEVEKEGLIDAMANISGLTQDKCRQYLKAIINPHNGDYEEFIKDGDDKKYIRKLNGNDRDGQDD